MSWQLASFSLLAAVLIGGFAWFERSRPPSQVVALVAALAALAVAGRLAFAAIPNVVATTDIVLFTGYTIGAAPGFAVGALAGLVSNLWLGQGPWTPWQMAGWGLTGVFGAMLAAASGRRLGRLSLAGACAFAGLAYGALLNFSLMVTYGGEQSLDRFAALSVRAIPFDLAHAGGNLVLALIAGPAMVRALSRFRRRFEVSWSSLARPAGVAVLIGLMAASVAVETPGARGSARGASAATAWLTGAANANGGFGGSPGDASNGLMTGWAALGLEAAGRNPLDVGQPGVNPIGWLRRHAGGVHGAGDLERTILAITAAGVDPRSFGGRDLVAELRAQRRADGSFGGQVNLTAFGIMALRAAASPRGNSGSASWLRGAQHGDGGWGFVPTASSDVDSTGAALQALVAARGRGRPTGRGARFLRRAQKPGGGFGISGAGGANVQSTAWAVQGLLAAGARPWRVTRGGHSPFSYIDARQASDGHYRYSTSSDQTPVWVTAQALLALKRKPLPLRPVARRVGGTRSRAGSGGRAQSAGGAGSKKGGVSGGGTGAKTGAGSAGGANSAGGVASAAAAGAAASSSDTGPTGQPAGSGESAPAAVGAEPASATAKAKGDSHRLLIALGGLGAIAVALVGGWFIVRRRLI